VSWLGREFQLTEAFVETKWNAFLRLT